MFHNSLRRPKDCPRPIPAQTFPPREPARHGRRTRQCPGPALPAPSRASPDVRLCPFLIAAPTGDAPLLLGAAGSQGRPREGGGGTAAAGTAGPVLSQLGRASPLALLITECRRLGGCDLDQVTREPRRRVRPVLRGGEQQAAHPTVFSLHLVQLGQALSTPPRHSMIATRASHTDPSSLREPLLQGEGRTQNREEGQALILLGGQM